MAVVAADGAAAGAAEEAVAAVALVAEVDSMAEVEVAGIAVAAAVRDERLRCLDLAVVAAADDLVEVTVVVHDPVVAAEVLVRVADRCSDRKAIGKVSAACRRQTGRAAESVNDQVAAVRARDLEQAARDRGRTLRVAAVVDQVLAVVRGPVAVGRRKDNSTTSWILAAVVADGLPWVVGLRSPVEPVDKRLATRHTISCAIGQLADSVRRHSPVPRALV